MKGVVMPKWMSRLPIILALLCWGTEVAWADNQNMPFQEDTSSSFSVPTEMGAGLNQDFGKPSDLIQIEDAMSEPDSEPVIVIVEEPKEGVYDKHGRVQATVTGARKNYEEKESTESKGAVITAREEIKYKSRDMEKGFGETTESGGVVSETKREETEYNLLDESTAKVKGTTTKGRLFGHERSVNSENQPLITTESTRIYQGLDVLEKGGPAKIQGVTHMRLEETQTEAGSVEASKESKKALYAADKEEKKKADLPETFKDSELEL